MNIQLALDEQPWNVAVTINPLGPIAINARTGRGRN